MSGTAVQKIDRGTGEVVDVETFDFKGYLTHLSGAKALQEQQQLAGAYDAACKSLIGPNDVQKDGGREFKKKSAWRKLARHFGISTSVIRQEEKYVGHDNTQQPVFVASVVVKASAPWGQSAEAVGACATDEETGRRTISIADAIATAETRATNRAISNLIAMGEVSAEEMGKGERRQASGPLAVTRATVVEFGKHKGKTVEQAGLDYWTFLLNKLPADDQTNSGKFIRAAHAALSAERKPTGSTDDFPEQFVDGDDDLPFDD